MICKHCGQGSMLGDGRCICQQYSVRDVYSCEQKTVYANGFQAAARQYIENKYKYTDDSELSDITTTVTVSKGQFVKTFNIASVVTVDWEIEEERK